MSEHQFIRVPPDSTGKKVFHRIHVIIGYENGTIAFEIGDSVVGSSSGANGYVSKVSGTTVSGTLDITLDNKSVEAFIGGENLQVGGVTNATFVTDSQKTYYIPNMMIAGGRTHNPAWVDNFGSLQTSRGENDLDAFGYEQSQELTTIAEYSYQYDKLTNLVSESTSGAATGTLSASGHYIDMEVTNADGDVIIRTTNLYHHFSLGQSQVCMTALWHGDSGKTGNIRRWGYFDEKNGAFFELNGTTLYVVIRSNATGSLLETKVGQSDWNLDTMDGDDDAENPSGHTLDITKTLIWFVDLSYPGDVVRFGFWMHGKRHILHRYDHGNQSSYPLFGHGNLPLRWENRNTSATSGTSNMYTIAGTVKTAGKFNPTQTPVSAISNYTSIPSSASYTPIFSGRMKQTFNGRANRRVLVPKTLEIHNNGNTGIEIALIFGGFLVGSTWSVDQYPTFSAVEIDNTATAVISGIIVRRFLIGANESKCADFTFPLETAAGKLMRYADVTLDPLHLTIGGKLLYGNTASNVNVIVNWVEF